MRSALLVGETLFAGRGELKAVSEFSDEEEDPLEQHRPVGSWIYLLSHIAWGLLCNALILTQDRYD